VSTDSSPWLAWQIVDSAFPTGAFAHSGGLEAAWQQGEIEDGEALQRFVQASIRQTATAAIPLVNAAYRDRWKLEALDTLADAFLTNAVANRASRIQGRTFVATASRIWPSNELADLQQQVVRLCAHVAPLTGAALRALGLPLRTVQRAVLFGAARGVLSSAVRLGITGSYEAQRLQWLCGPCLDEQLERCAELDERHLAQTAPILDLLQAGHDRLYSRLFQS
jgi:urease accessory protein